MAKKKKANVEISIIGKYFFLGGVLLAIVIALLEIIQLVDSETLGILTMLLVALGLYVGSLNITAKESHEFLITAAILVFLMAQGGSTTLEHVGLLGPLLVEFFDKIILFVIPAVIIVAIRKLFRMEMN